MDFITKLADGFIGMFEEGGEVFTGFITDIIPLLIVLITAVNALVKLIGEDRVNNFIQKITKFTILRYTLVPFLAVFFFTNPMCYTVGRFLPEKYKPAYYDSTVSFLHPVTGLFPHANSAELFIWLGVAQGFSKAGGEQSQLALMFLLTGLIVILMRGFITEKISMHLFKKEGLTHILNDDK
ncbi:PTS glucitol/sorbitol transporter subunit IIC [Staphylococcus arlettae]|uniref:PTS glucitol/sorbitol transporter subunit IIC n=2 Tax=Staphylococcus arlettae TaxID=29378 RepID=UPI000D1B7CFB|nr:PTS glucitol/sorbitol transporter subunit IIC [Staphylococcus arlettae]MEB7421399.1 PTS glucitol/sorbitol transporter subunit IIC [Staphylococcus arlettae]PTH29795.1 PTS sorbitol transporter subunit IIC [Staphylococcus arlettae]PTH55313.1 PTS sorbitol transporter subunit IIC [Staphylococcus arlettae]PTH57611.1 PTS sorbitol transporter subunit IIC [Staphylococcus arlettae]PTH61326.1 PTS sorbitol transporter subunit IIC [Staphylococcus arlettae]